VAPFTLVGATTRSGALTGPLRDRFGFTAHMDFYEPAELERVLARSAGILGIELGAEAGAEIARRSRGTPRIANRLLRRVRDYAEVRADGVIDGAVARAALDVFEDEPRVQVAVVGAHLSGMPLNGQLTERGATLVQATTTAPHYRLYALAGTVPPKPGLQRSEDGAAIALEVWSMPQDAVGSFLALIPPPLGLGSVELADGRWVHGFICEGHALAGAEEVTRHGGWRAYVASLKTKAPA